MKELVAASMVMLLLCTCTDDESEPGSNPIFEGNVWLLTQAEVDEFGKKKIRRINGNLKIGHGCSWDSNCGITTDITDITPLRGISYIEGELFIDAHPLRSLDGLESLSYVSKLRIGISDYLTSLEQLSNIDSIPGYIQLWHVNYVQDLYGFHNLKYIGGMFLVHGAHGVNELESLDELKVLEHVGGLTLENCDRLNNLAGLEKITEAQGDVVIQYNDNLHELQGLNNLLRAGNVKIYDNSELNDLCALVPLVKNGQVGAFTVKYNAYNPTKDDLLNGVCSK